MRAVRALPVGMIEDPRAQLVQKPLQCAVHSLNLPKKVCDPGGMRARMVAITSPCCVDAGKLPRCK
jgi:hypothetical protein